MLVLFALLCAMWCHFIANVTGSSDFVFPGKSYDLFPALPVGVIDTENVLCRKQTMSYIENLRNLSLWAYEMQDATAKSTTGVLKGSIFQFGQFEECLKSQSPFSTQYCLAAINAIVPEPVPARDLKSLYYEANESILRKMYNKEDPSQQPKNLALMGWCMPASCTTSDLENYLNYYLNTTKFNFYKYNVTYTAQIHANSCQREDERIYLDYLDVSFCLVVALLIIITISSTFYHALRNKTEDKLTHSSPLRKLAIAFSLKYNYNKLAVTNHSNPALQILYGMRVFCILMIIMDHRFGTHLSTGILNFNKVEEQYRSPVGTLFFHGDLFVDSFFIMSGLLVTYSLLTQYQKKIVNPVLVIFMRYIRMTPAYAFVIFYYATLLNFSGSGPMWKTIINSEVQDCRKNWWTNILYISNYVNSNSMCMVHSWYLPCDFHYFIIAILLCILIKKRKRIGLSLLALITIISVIIPFIIGFINMRPAILFFYPDFLRSPKTSEDFLLTYSKSHTRASPYFVGMITGYIFYKIKGSKQQLKKIYSHIIFTVSIILMVGSIVTGTIFYNPYYKYNAIESALYAALHRTVWAIGSVGILYVASYGHAKFIYKFLSWKPWVPLSKLVFGAYLVHMQFQLRAVARKGGANFVTYFDVISMALSDIILAFGTSLILYLHVEAPFRNIINLLLMSSKDLKKEADKTFEKNIIKSQATCDSHL